MCECLVDKKYTLRQNRLKSWYISLCGKYSFEETSPWMLMKPPHQMVFFCELAKAKSRGKKEEKSICKSSLCCSQNHFALKAKVEEKEISWDFVKAIQLETSSLKDYQNSFSIW